MADMQESEGKQTRADLFRLPGVLPNSAAVKRTRVVDDHMFAVSGPFAVLGTFRLQLFTAPGARPVAVATQTSPEGMSLVNAAEEYASAVWQRLCPNEPEPPIWIQRQLLERDSLTYFELVTFSLAPLYALSSPAWQAMPASPRRQAVRPGDHRACRQAASGCRGPMDGRLRTGSRRPV